MDRIIPKDVYKGIDPHVVRGSRLLDVALGPDWDRHINLLTLDMDSAGYCILGQTFRQSIWDGRNWRPGYAMGRAGEFIEYHTYKLPYYVGDEWLGNWAAENEGLLKKIDGEYNPSFYGFMRCRSQLIHRECPNRHIRAVGFRHLKNHWVKLIQRRLDGINDTNDSE